MMTAVAQPSNWQAYLELVLRRGPQRTQMVPIKRHGPLSVQRSFYPEGDACHVYLLHPPGGVVGGDRLELDITAETDASGLITTPGATKFYYSAGETAQVNQRFQLHAQSALEYLPQENIYFPGARIRSNTTIHVTDDSSAILWEKHCFGRPANDETFDQGLLDSTLQISSHGQLLFTERQYIDAEEISRSSGLRGHAVIGTTLIYSAGLDQLDIDILRQLSPLQGHCGISRLDDNLLIIRYLGTSTQDLNQWFVQLWNLYRQAIIQRQPCEPRIWNT